ncbi:MAG: hypothetical protein ACRDFX_13945 [Chloroflexota bacterium]
MTSLIRIAALFAAFAALAVLPTAPSSAHAARFVAVSPADRTLVHHASTMAARSPHSASRWLAGRHGVASAHVESNGQTIAIAFRDGARLLILPKTRVHDALSKSSRVFRAAFRPLEISHQTPPTSGPAQALVLEPFAGELNLGSNAGQREADSLTQAGFKVTILRDSAVTVHVMMTLNQYAVVYMETHSNPISSGGDAVVATAETDTTPYASLFKEGSLKQVTVAGDTTGKIYDAITGIFFTDHVGTFTPGSLLFINGCGVRDAPLFVKAVQGRDVAALIGWDNEVPGLLNAVTGSYVMGQLAGGATVAASVNSALETGLGIAVSGTTAATLGFDGQGSDTLANALAGAEGTTATATSTATPTATPTSTPSPTATPKPTKRYHHGKCHPGHHRVHGGRCQLIKHHSKKSHRK